VTDDPFGGRDPTSHERVTGLPWDASYGGGPAPWDIGRPQPAIARLAADGAFAGPLLDAGCGTGENALHIAALGLRVLGVDVAETAIGMARAKAAERGLDAAFAVADALALDRLDRRFRTVLDCGLFHTLDAAERPRYVASLASATEDGGTVYVLCFSDARPDAVPHPIRRGELRSAFDAGGWEVVAIAADGVLTRFHDDRGAPAWLATIKRSEAGPLEG
jgi:SAM-dependent methyltransferase